MFSAILRHFPENIPLILVHDPDDLLADERLLAELHARGFTVIQESDPVRLRYRYTHSTPPRVVVTKTALNALPYDLWQQGHHITLALHEFFPNLAYPLVQALTAEARARLYEAPAPPRRLGDRATQEYIFRHVFDLDLNALGDPFTLVAWLSDAPHRQPLPNVFRETLRQRLKAEPAYANWPVDDLLDHPETLSAFLQDQWLSYLRQRGLLRTGETTTPYLLDFNRPRWQDLLPRWLRNGLLRPVPLEGEAPPEPWLAGAVLSHSEDARLKHIRLLTEALKAALEKSAPKTYAAWADTARRWAELTALRYASDDLPAAEAQTIQRLQTRLDDLFPRWLEHNYPALSGKVLPEPHHLHHVLPYLAAQRRKGQAERLALVILDGLSFADWFVLWEGWRARHSWQVELRPLLAQIPTITAISRQALVSGLRPAAFADTITHNRAESRHWERFWQSEELSPSACLLTRELSTFPAPPDAQAICLIVNTIDEIHHRTLLGPQDAQTSLRRWRDHHAAALENLLDELIHAGFSLWLTSDHGHVAAHGIGQPREGLIVETRGLRARTYRDENLARAVQRDYPETYLWHDDGLLPDDLWALIPHGRMAFAPKDEIHITHGGLTLEEVFVPLVRLKPS